MTVISTFLENKVLDHVLGSTSYTMPTTYLGLFTTTPTMPAGTGGVEVSGGSYARYALGTGTTSFSAAASGSKTNNGTLAFVTATGSWGTVVGVGIFDALTTGNLLYAAALSVSKTVGTGDVFEFTASNLTATLA